MNNSKKIHKVVEKNGRSMFIFWCPACKMNHAFYTGTGSPSWTFNNDFHIPTVTPSLRIRGENPEPWQCHLFLSVGNIIYLNDCTHNYAGKTIEVPDWEDDEIS